MIWSIPTIWQFPELFLMFLPMMSHKPTFPSFRPVGMVGETRLPSNAYCPRTPDYPFILGVHVCWFEHSDSSFVYGFMRLIYGLGTMITTTTYYFHQQCV